MTLESLITLAIAMTLLTIKPGPGMMALITRALADGFKPAAALIFGIATVQAIFFVIAAYGFSLIQEQMVFFSILLKSIGAAYLIYLGFKGFVHLEAGIWAGKVDQQTKVNVFENYIAGAAITLGNPFVILFYAAIIPTIMDLDNLRIEDVIIATAVLISVNLAINLTEAAIASKIRDVLKKPEIVKWMNIITSTAFIMIGLFIGWTIFPITEFNLGFTF